jgi:hypothetical protein
MSLPAACFQACARQLATHRDNKPVKSVILFLAVRKYNVLRSSGWRNE